MRRLLPSEQAARAWFRARSELRIVNTKLRKMQLTKTERVLLRRQRSRVMREVARTESTLRSHFSGPADTTSASL